MQRNLFLVMMALIGGVLAQAQTAFNQNIFPLGDQESLLGNTGTGGVNSSGAVFYNPAALSQLEGTKVSFNGNVYFHFKNASTPLLVVGNQYLDQVSEGYRSLPGSLVLTRTFGKWTLGVSVLLPTQTKLDGATDWVANNFLGDTVSLRLTNHFTEDFYLGGFSAARKLGNGWSVGATLFGKYYASSSYVDLRGRVMADPSKMVLLTNRQVVSTLGVVAVLGVLKEWEKVNVGLRLALPSVALYGTGSYYNETFSNVTGLTQSTVANYDQLTSRYPTPMEFRLGVTWKPNNDFFWAADASFALPRAFEFLVYPGSQSSTHAASYRFSNGAEWRVKERLKLYLGGSINPSSNTSGGISLTNSVASLFGGSSLYWAGTRYSLGLFYNHSRKDQFIGNGEVGVNRADVVGIAFGTTVSL